jgi:hypothetical protein
MRAAAGRDPSPRKRAGPIALEAEHAENVEPRSDQRERIATWERRIGGAMGDERGSLEHCAGNGVALRRGPGGCGRGVADGEAEPVALDARYGQRGPVRKPR